MDSQKNQGGQPEFHHFHAGDIAGYAHFYELRSNLTSDSTPLESFLWRKYFDARAAVLRDGERELGLLWLYGTEEEPYAAMPLAREEDLPACFEALQHYFREVLKKPLVIKLADGGAVNALNLSPEKYLVEEEEDAKDYLYDGNALRTQRQLPACAILAVLLTVTLLVLVGVSWHLLRSHDDHTRKKMPDLTVLDKWRGGKGEEVESHLDREVDGIHDLLNHCSEISAETGAIFIDGELEAFSVGSLNRRDSMAVIHIEKANPEIDGLYQAINKEFLCRAFPEAAIINREDDVGLEGLRKSKLSYYPSGFAKKFLIMERSGAELSADQVRAEMQY